MTIQIYATPDNFCYLWSSDGNLDQLDDFASKLGIPNTRCAIRTDAAFGDFELYHYRLSKGREQEKAQSLGAQDYDLRRWQKEQLERERQADLSKVAVADQTQRGVTKITLAIPDRLMGEFRKIQARHNLSQIEMLRGAIKLYLLAAYIEDSPSTWIIIHDEGQTKGDRPLYLFDEVESSNDGGTST